MMNFETILSKRRLRKVSPFFLYLCVAFILIYLGLQSFHNRKLETFCPNPNSSQDEKLQQNVNRLESVLRRYNIPEREYITGLLPMIYVITPTFARPEQKAELVRLKNTFLHIRSLHWIIIEDANKASPLVANLLKSSGLTYTHLFMNTPEEWKLQSNDHRWMKPRGVLQRNEGIKWLQENTHLSEKGVVYFADDDNTYSISLFEEMRWTKKVSIWPVGLVGARMVERPKVNAQGKVFGWLVDWRPDRPFATDMAGFSVNLSLLLNKKAKFSLESARGLQESDFLQKLVRLEELEPKANSCSEVLVWHTQSIKTKILNKDGYWKDGQFVNGEIEV